MNGFQEELVDGIRLQTAQLFGDNQFYLIRLKPGGGMKNYGTENIFMQYFPDHQASPVINDISASQIGFFQ